MTYISLFLALLATGLTVYSTYQLITGQGLHWLLPIIGGFVAAIINMANAIQ